MPRNDEINPEIIATTKRLHDAAILAEFIQREFPGDDQLEIIRLAMKAIYPSLRSF